MMKTLRKIRTIKVLLLLTVVAMTFVGCGKKPKDEAELQQDLLNSNYIWLSEDSQITDFEIIKRLTEKENHKDTVYVSMKIENEFFYETAAYVMNYTEYNDGWSLDNVETYYGNDFEYKAVPLKAPSQEMVFDEVRWDSDISVQTFFEEWDVLSVRDLYFFEDGTYSYEIIDEEIDLDNGNYSCKLTVDREFELVNVHEVIDVAMWFEDSNHDFFGWNLSGIEISEISYDWDIEGTWTHPDEEYPVVISGYNNNDGEPYVNVKFMAKDVFGKECAQEETFYFRPVSSERIQVTRISPESGFSFQFLQDLKITPNKILDNQDNSEAWVRID